MPRQTARGGSPANELTGHERMDIKGSVSLARGRMHSLVSSIAVVSHSRCRRRVLCVHTALSHPPSEAADRFQPDAGRVSLFHGPLPIPTPGLALCRRAIRDGPHRVL